MWEVFDVWSGRIILRTRHEFLARLVTARVWRRSWDYDRPHWMVERRSV